MQRIVKKLSFKRVVVLVVVIVVSTLLITKCGTTEQVLKDDVSIVVDTTEAQQAHMKYGLPIEDYEIENQKVKRRQSLSTILDKYGISPQKVNEISYKAKDVFNVRKIRAGKSYFVLFSKDSLRTPEYFIYEESKLEYIVFDLQDEISVTKGEKEVEYKIRTVKGTIESSVWNSLVENDADPLLAINISEIYAWTIDFFGITKGDSFKVMYKQGFVEGKALRAFDVKAAVLVHQGKEYYAYKYNQDGKDSYFDEEGNNLQKAFLKAPLKYSRISSRFSNRRYHPVLKKYRAHHGIDYAAPTGTPVFSIGDGRITKKAYQRRGGGKYLKIKHNGVYSTCYMHLSRYAKGMRPGVSVKQGQIIGYVGMTGLATGPHLDFRVYKYGSAINPLRMKSPSKSPIKEVNKANYLSVKNQLEERLKDS